MFDALLGAALRQVYRRVLQAPQTDEAQLPRADSTHRYLLYLHIPYCVVLCPFCTFHRVRFKKDSAERYFDCLRREIEIVTAAGYCFDELYVGGGTPTVLPEQLATTINLVRKRHPLGPISVETNPDDLDKDSVHHLRDLGVNRLSVGVQSFDDDLLREMQRFDKYGSGADMIEALRRESGAFDTLNIDMIFNFPHQTESSLRRDLDILIEEVCADQVSWYPLMAAANTSKAMTQSMGRVDHAREKYFYTLIAERMLQAGYVRSSAWCFSRKPGMFDEYIVDHEDYVGLGSGAFSYLQGSLYASTFSINHYQQLLTAGKTGTVQQRSLHERDQMRYFLLMRLFSGSLERAVAEKRFRGRFKSVLRAELAALRLMGSIQQTEDSWSLTERGYFEWVVIMREFFSAVAELRDQMRHHISAEHIQALDG